MAEYWDLLDGQRQPLGRLHRRGDPLPEGCYHQVVHVWTRDREGRFLISRRHPQKHFGLFWETTGGSVLAGEDSRAAARRELEEELGVTVDASQGALLMTQRRERDFYDVWMFEWNGDLSQLKLQAEEVVEARWATYEELCALEEAGTLVPSLKYFHELFGGVRNAPVAIGPMRIEDYDAIYGFWSGMRGMGLNDVDDSREGIGRFLARNPGTCFVAKCADGLVGTVLCGHDGRRAHLYHAAVAPSMRGRGVGRALIGAALQALKAEGIAKASLLVFADNEGGQRFWQELGFGGRTDVRYMDVQLRPIRKFDPK